MNAKNMFGAITVAIALFFLWPAVFGSWSEMRALKDALAERTQLEKDAPDAATAIFRSAKALGRIGRSSGWLQICR